MAGRYAMIDCVEPGRGRAARALTEEGNPHDVRRVRGRRATDAASHPRRPGVRTAGLLNALHDGRSADRPADRPGGLLDLADRLDRLPHRAVLLEGQVAAQPGAVLR